ncbi:hypothetical protein EV141_0303 [Microcella putealis]|uniref:Uncharacterized protein n=2 Tax=Microcella putealis TaxID=337005 RepID=A0A4Q7LVL6_9MICO|nr:hypothetical protein EV141_0303 [Microcella putealis]TQM24112.1 hypothetical protein BJ957_1582 [Microcella putealis]
MQRGGTTATLRATRSGTIGGWFVALTPLLSAAAIVGLVFAVEWSLRTGSLASVWADPFTSAMVFGGTGVILALLIIMAVVSDRRRLESLGHRTRASGWWILLGALPYLIARTVRTRREAGRGQAPLVVHLIIGALVATGLTVAPFVLPREASVAQMRAVEATITNDLTAQGLELSVICPDTADARVGSRFVCTASDESGDIVGLIDTRWSGIDGSVIYSLDAGSPGE